MRASERAGAVRISAENGPSAKGVEPPLQSALDRAGVQATSPRSLPCSSRRARSPPPSSSTSPRRAAPRAMAAAAPSPLVSLLGDNLLQAKGGATVATADALRGKTVGLYFSAHWCPPCVPASAGARASARAARAHGAACARRVCRSCACCAPAGPHSGAWACVLRARARALRARAATHLRHRHARAGARAARGAQAAALRTARMHRGPRVRCRGPYSATLCAPASRRCALCARRAAVRRPQRQRRAAQRPRALPCSRGA
jgi:hypothetical protein